VNELKVVSEMIYYFSTFNLLVFKLVGAIYSAFKLVYVWEFCSSLYLTQYLQNVPYIEER